MRIRCLGLLAIAGIGLVAGTGSSTAAPGQAPPVRGINPAGNGIPAALGQFEVRTVSSRPEMVSGDDSLVEVAIPPGEDPSGLTVEVNGVDRTTDFATMNGDPHRLRGLVDGLAAGENRVVASLPGYPDRTLILVDHPTTGPVLSGPWQQPFACTTEANDLGPPLDANCFAPTRTVYRYRTTGGSFATLADPSAPYPANGAMTTTSEGNTVPFAVAIERGVINRAIYTVETLIDVGPGFEPGRAGSGFNGRMVYHFGGGCEAGYHQGIQGAAVNANVAAGYAFGQSTLNRFGNRCSDHVSAETLSMVKEHFSETWGPIEATIGIGGSGGSMAQQMLNNNFPGLLDGSILGNSFTDNAYAANLLMDCQVVDSYVDSAGWTDSEKHAVKGGALEQTCDTTFAAFGANFFGPSDCPATVPSGDRYDPVSNPNGLRCDVWDGNRNLWGTDPDTGFARQAVDNVGVQYGLRALRDGSISAGQFIDLNENVGSLDHDGRPQPGRRSASTEALRLAYRSGSMNEGGAGALYTPALDNRNHSIETIPNGHQTVHALSMRARMTAAAGGAEVPHVIYTSPEGLPVTGLVPKMDEWIDAIRADQAIVGPRARAVRNRPPEMTDSCFDAAGDLIAKEEASLDSGTCGSLYPSAPVTRMLAGGPIENDVLKCRLKPVDPADYPASLTASELDAIRDIFPDGVCDYSRPGVEQVISRDTWRALPLNTTVDTTAPDTAISSSPPATGAGAEAGFAFSANETGADFQCRLDSNSEAAWVDCDQGRLYAGLARGRHTFMVRAIDPTGIIDPTPATFTFRVGDRDATGSGPRAKLKIGKLRRAGKRVRLTVTCSLKRMHHCSGRVRLKVRRGALGIRKRPRRWTGIASRGYRVGAGRHRLSLRLGRRARRAAGRPGPLRVRVRASVKQRSGRTVRVSVRRRLR